MELNSRWTLGAQDGYLKDHHHLVTASPSNGRGKVITVDQDRGIAAIHRDVVQSHVPRQQLQRRGTLTKDLNVKLAGPGHSIAPPKSLGTKRD